MAITKTQNGESRNGEWKKPGVLQARISRTRNTKSQNL